MAAAAAGPPGASAAVDDPTVTNNSELQLQQYLQRIGLQQRPADLSLDSLTLLHRQHALSIPFENLLFVHHALKGTQRPVDIASLHKRLVLRRRGGMCQEQNSLVLHNLKQLGYNAYAGLAMMVVEGTLQPASTPLQGPPTSQQLGATQTCFGSHQIVIVTIEGRRYLCDVGAGPKCIAEPVLIRAYDDVPSSSSSSDGSSGCSSGWQQPPPPADWLAARGECQQFGMRYRIRRGVLGSAEPLASAAVASHPERDSFVGYYLQHLIKGSWTDMYWFSLTPVSPTVLQACSEHSFRHHPLFTQHLIVSHLVEGGGRNQLVDWCLKTRLEGQPTLQRQLAPQTEEERDAVLREVFRLDLSGPPLPA